MQLVKGPDSKDAALEEMVIRYQLSLLRLCFAYLHDEELAKDAVQDTFLKAYRHMEKFEGRADEKTWLTRIAINACKDIKRSRWFRFVDRSVTPDMLPEPAAPTDTEEENLTLAIMRLPPKLKEVALLCWYQDMTYQEAAEVLGISFQVVGSRLNRARKKLRFAIENGKGRE